MNKIIRRLRWTNISHFTGLWNSMVLVQHDRFYPHSPLPAPGMAQLRVFPIYWNGALSPAIPCKDRPHKKYGCMAHYSQVLCLDNTVWECRYSVVGKCGSNSSLTRPVISCNTAGYIWLSFCCSSVKHTTVPRVQQAPCYSIGACL